MITTVTTVTTLANAAMAYNFGILATLFLIALLIAKELSGASVSSAGSSDDIYFASSLDRMLNVAIIPLLIVFAVIVVDKVMSVLH